MSLWSWTKASTSTSGGSTEYDGVKTVRTIRKLLRCCTTRAEASNSTDKIKVVYDGRVRMSFLWTQTVGTLGRLLTCKVYIT